MNRLTERITLRHHNGTAYVRRHLRNGKVILEGYFEDRDRARQIADLHADYYSAPLYVDGRRKFVKRSTDPKWFGGITRESLPY